MQLAPERTVHVEHCMGTVFTIEVRDPGRWDDAVAEVVAWLHHVDAVFSTYKETSDISRIRRGALAVEDADADVQPVLELCAQVEIESAGWFSAHYAGALDPTGLVKGWAIERGAAILSGRGSRNHAVNGGGDIQLVGESSPGQPWVVGIVDPLDPSRILTTVRGRDLAVATSGTGERGLHIIDPISAAPAEGVASVTVVGPSLTRADAYATAAFAMGPAGGLAWIDDLIGYEGFFVTPDGRSASTGGFHR